MRRASIHEQYDVRTGGRLGSNIPPNTYSAALARGLPSKGEMRRTSIHEQYDVGTGGSASGTGDYGTGGTGGILCKKNFAKKL